MVDDDFITSYCPEGTTLTASGGGMATLDHLRTDQSGIIGVIRQLHNLGCVILQLTTAKDPA
jgi:hypothetical protein